MVNIMTLSDRKIAKASRASVQWRLLAALLGP